MNLDNIIIDRSPLDKAIRLETMRAEIEPQGYTIVSNAWLRKLNEAVLKRKLLEETA
jgi:hypothetical protein